MDGLSTTVKSEIDTNSLSVSWGANIFDVDCSILCPDNTEISQDTRKNDLLEQLGQFFYPNESLETQELHPYIAQEDGESEFSGLNGLPADFDDLFAPLTDGEQDYLANNSPTCSSGYGSSQSSLSSIDSGEIPFPLSQATADVSNNPMDSRLPPLSTVFCNKMVDQGISIDIDSMIFPNLSCNSKPAESVLEMNVPYFISSQQIPNSQVCRANDNRILICPSGAVNGMPISNFSAVNQCRGSESVESKKPSRPRKRTANDREKNRTHNVNSAFQNLRMLIPTDPIDRKLSKVETLRLAISYINHLGMTLHSDEWIEQPCLSRRRTTNGEEYLSVTEGPVCTFCMSKTKINTKKHTID
ncbi:uncharacterized protein LOC120340850 [Styela clava]